MPRQKPPTARQVLLLNCNLLKGNLAVTGYNLQQYLQRGISMFEKSAQRADFSKFPSAFYVLPSACYPTLLSFNSRNKSITIAQDSDLYRINFLLLNCC
jgi:hypothetical protein